MRNAKRTVAVMAGCGLLLLGAGGAHAQDWPQWRGPNRDNKVTGFTAPAAWPKALTQKWKVKVGLGDASPVLVGDKVYVFTREGDDEVTTCLDAATGKTVWQDKYPAKAVTGPDRGHAGPRSTPAVGGGKICTFGVAGTVSCLDAATGKVVWRKETKGYPRFHTSSSPMLVDGKCVVYVGGSNGSLTAYDLATGKPEWQWTGAGAPYGSPVVMTVEGTKLIVTPTNKSLVGVRLDNGKLQWEIPFAPRYNNATPVIAGQTVIFTGQGLGTVALKVEKEGDKFVAKELWKKQQSAHQYNTPVLKDGLLFGLAPAGGRATNLFCMDAKTGDVLWTDTTPRGECGTVLDAGSVLLALTSDSKLVAFRPSNKGYTELARFTVAETPTWAYPIISGNRVFVKDRDSLALWTID
jgi:outer membrane protein assembly factor BamB